MKRAYFIPLSMALILGLSSAVSPVFAADNVSDLKAQIEALQKRVEELEAARSKPAQQAPPSNAFQNPGSAPWGGGWDPFDEMSRIQEEMNRMFQRSFSNPGFAGSGKAGMFKNNMFYDEDYNIQETKDGYQLTFDMSGFDQDKVNIDVNGHSITISGQQSSQEDQSKGNGYFESRSYGSFLKTVPLPPDADPQKMETKKDGNTLIIKIPKKTKSL
jgi:HSP20 family protein